MAVEIQTFILSRNLDAPPGRLPNLLDAGIYEVFPTGGKFPIQGKLPFYLVLRKDSAESEIEFKAQVRIINADGAALSPPGIRNISGKFPAGFRFWRIAGAIKFAFPAAGSYSVMLDVESEGMSSQFRYDIECKKAPDVRLKS